MLDICALTKNTNLYSCCVVELERTAFYSYSESVDDEMEQKYSTQKFCFRHLTSVQYLFI